MSDNGHKKRKALRTFGWVLVGLAIVLSLVRHYYSTPLASCMPSVRFGRTFLLIAGGVFLMAGQRILGHFIYDNEEWEPNSSMAILVRRLRLRAILFNNLAVGLLLMSILAILVGPFLYSGPTSAVSMDATADVIHRSVILVLLIFLVQVLFRVFKYLIRVGSFYHGIADALELKALNTELDLKDLLERLAPSAYDISDVESASLLGTIKDLVKGK